MPEVSLRREALDQLSADFKRVFAGDQADRVLAYLLTVGCFWDTTHVPGDSHTTALNEGKRCLVLQIQQFINMTSERLDALQDQARELLEGEE